MFDLCGALFGLVMVLGIITFVGHGIWVFFEALFSNASTAQQPTKGEPPWKSSREEWAAAIRQLNELQERGLITQDRLDAMLAIVREQRRETFNEEREREIGIVTEPAPPTEPQKPIIIEPPQVEQPVEIVEFEDTDEPVFEQPAPSPVTTPAEPIAPKPASPEPAPAKPRRDFGGILQAFMEEKNIRWGELVSGMLIVGSGIGLVISLWSTLREAIPYFPALLFMLCTTAIHGAGLYTLRRWNLKSTSRGLLLISTLLIPLNFLAAIALSGQPGSPGYVEMTSPIYWIAVGIGVLGYGVIAFSAGRVFRKQHWWIFWLAVMVPSIALLIIARTATGLSRTGINLLASLPVLGFACAMAAQLAIAGYRRFHVRRATHTFQILGIGAFTVVMALGLLAYRSGSWRTTFEQMSPVFSVFSVLITAGGLVVHLRATRSDLAGQRTAGTTISLAGSAMMLIGLGFAWPQPDLLIAVGIVDAVALTGLAMAGRLPVLHIPAIAAVAFTSLLTLHLQAGTITPNATGSQLVESFMLGRSGLLLLGLAVAAGGGAWLWNRSDRGEIARSYLWSAAGLAVVSLFVAIGDGFIVRAEPEYATPVLIAVAVAALATCRRFEQPALVWAGAVLTFASSVHVFRFNESMMSWLSKNELYPFNPFILSGLFAAGFVGCLGIVGMWQRRRNGRSNSNVVDSHLLGAATLFSAFCLPAIMFQHNGEYGIHTAYLGWVMALWGTMAVVSRSRELTVATQVVSFVAIGFLATTIATHLNWWNANFADPRYWQVLLGSLAGGCLVWGVARDFAKPNTTAAKLLAPRDVNIDHLVLAGTMLGTIVLAIIGVLPGLSQELQLLDNGGFIPRSYDFWIGATIVVTAIGAMIAVAIGLLRENGGVFVLAGLAIITIMATQLTGVTAESYVGAVGVSHTLASGVGTWLLLVLVATGLLLSLREQVTPIAIGALVVLGGLVPVLIAGGFEERIDTATMLRFGLAGYALMLLAIDTLRKPLTGVVSRFGIRLPESDQAAAITVFRGTAAGVTLWPILAITFYTVLHIAGGDAVAGRLLPTIFEDYDIGVSYGLPVWILAGMLLWKAVALNNQRLALGGSLLIQLGMTLLFALSHWTAHGSIGPVGIVELLQWNGIGLGVGSLLWIYWQRKNALDDADQPDQAFVIQLGIMAATAALPAVWAAVAIILSPTQHGDIIAQLGHWLGFASFGLAATALVLSTKKLSQRSPIDAATIAGLALVPLLAAAASSFSGRLEWNDTWLTYHVLMAGWGVITAVTAAVSLLPRFGEWKTETTGRALLLAGLLVFLGWRAQLSDDPQRPWWFVGAAAFAALLWGIYAIAHRRQVFAYTSAGFTLLTAIAAMSKPWIGLGPDPTQELVLNDGFILLIVTASIGLLWLAVDVFRQRRFGEELEPDIDFPPTHHTAAGMWTLIVAVYSFVALWLRERGADSIASQLPMLISPLGVGVLASGIVLLFATLWDRRGLHAIPALFITGLTVSVGMLDGINAGVVFEEIDLTSSHIWLSLAGIAAGYVLLTAIVWSQRRSLAKLGTSSRMAEQLIENSYTGYWLPWANLVLALFVVPMGFWAVLSFELPEIRYSAGIATLAIAPALAMFAQSSRAAMFRFLSLAAGVIACVQFAWALPLPDELLNLTLERAIRFLEVTAVATLVLAALPMARSKQESWGLSVRQIAVTTGFASLIGLGLVLAIEAYLFQPKVGVPIANVQIAVVAGILVALIAGLIVLAVRPGRDPLNLSETGRRLYVYIAEAVGGLLFLHLYLTRPDWFGHLMPWWPYIVIGIAYIGVGIGELCKRKQLDVLAEPLQRTATFLPLLPAIAFWVQTQSENRPFDEYSQLLFLSGLMYVGLAIFRQSLRYSLAAALVGNLALWSLYGHYGSNILERPQVWLIPPALSLLVAGQLNRNRLSEAQLTAIRYFSALVIYAASTAELFIYGARDPNNWWHPIVLASLSLAGILFGMLMRIRAFLYLGTSFLLLAMVSMVWHAARMIDDVWPWWAFGILTGIALLAMFGVFEKKRDEVLGTLRKLKEWEA